MNDELTDSHMPRVASNQVVNCINWILNLII